MAIGRGEWLRRAQEHEKNQGLHPWVHQTPKGCDAQSPGDAERSLQPSKI
jgi:hypothetical protein